MPWTPGGIRPEPSEVTWVMFKWNLLDRISRRSDQFSSISDVCSSAARSVNGFSGGPLLATCANRQAGEMNRKSWFSSLSSRFVSRRLWSHLEDSPRWTRPPTAQACADSAHLIEFASDGTRGQPSFPSCISPLPATAALQKPPSPNLCS